MREGGSKDVCEFVITKRFSELYEFNKRLFEELKPYLKKNRFPLSDFPSFPSKTFLSHTDFNFISRRISALNAYFQHIFMQYPSRVPYTVSLGELCAPTTFNLRLIGDTCIPVSLVSKLLDILTKPDSDTHLGNGALAMLEEKRSEKRSMKRSRSEISRAGSAHSDIRIKKKYTKE